MVLELVTDDKTRRKKKYSEYTYMTREHRTGHVSCFVLCFFFFFFVTWTGNRVCSHCKIFTSVFDFEYKSIVFWGCCMHLSHIATSLYIFMQNDLTLIEQVMAHWWLLRHSQLALLVNSMSSQPWLHTPLQHALQVKSVKGGIWMTK